MLDFLFGALGPESAPTLSDLSDARVWLEDVEGASALEWVKAKNSEALHVLGNPAEQHVYSRIL